MTNPNSWINPPPDGPTQADRGAYVYWMHCMVCHGDRGQGLASFRSSYPKADQDCGIPKCHGGPNPGAGFGFPDAPAIEGTGTLTRFATAADLYDFIHTRMPYQAPGTLSSDDYWSLVSYLLKQRNALPTGVTLDAADSSAIPVSPRQGPSLGAVAAVAGIGLLIAVVISLWSAFRWRAKRR